MSWRKGWKGFRGNRETWKQVEQKRRETLGKKQELINKVKDDKNQALLNMKNKDTEVSELSKEVLRGKASKRDRFVFITKEEMENILIPAGFTQVDPTELFNTREYVYDRPYKNLPHIKIRIFSSVDDLGVSRRKGKDAIRICIYDSKIERLVSKGKSVYRIQGWDVRIKDKVNEVYKSLSEIPTCKKCGSYKAERKIKKGARIGQTFWGCTNYPECDGREPRQVEYKPVHTVSLVPPF